MLYILIVLFIVVVPIYMTFILCKNKKEINEYTLCHLPYKPVPKYMIKNHSQYSQCTECESICPFCNRPKGICSSYTHKH